MAYHGEIHEKFKGVCDNTVTRYKDGYYKNVKCIHYEPCPICFRCEVKNKKYKKCRNCEVKKDYHTTREKNMMIRKGRKDLDE